MGILRILSLFSYLSTNVWQCYHLYPCVEVADRNKETETPPLGRADVAVANVKLSPGKSCPLVFFSKVLLFDHLQNSLTNNHRH